MSISKKVFWIFLSIVFVIFSLGITVYIYQHGTQKMHGVLHALINFNDKVYQLRELQSMITSEDFEVTEYNLKKQVSELQTATDELAGSLFKLSRSSMDIESLRVNINNYFLAFREYSEIADRRDLLVSNMKLYVSALYDMVHFSHKEHGDKFHELEISVRELMSMGDAVYVQQIDAGAELLKQEIDNPAFAEILDALARTAESLYVEKLNLRERREFLNSSSEYFLRAASKLSGDIRERDALLSRVLGYAATAITVLCILMALVYWVIINKYVRRFLTNQSEVMQAIKNREVQREMKPFSNDELGNLTLKMWEMAAELRDKDVELVRSEKKYRTYISTTPIAVLVTDFDRKLMEVNPGAVTMLGYSEEEFMNMTLDDVWLDMDGQGDSDRFDSMMSNGRHSFIRVMNAKDGSEVFVNVSATKADENRFVAFCQDVTERIRLEKKLKEINENLTEQIRQEVEKNMKQDQVIQQQKKLADMGMMMSAIAHQWRQPLNALALCVQDVIEEFESDNLNEGYVQEFEETSMKLIMHMSKTIDDFRDFFLPDKTVTEFNVVREINDLMRLISVQIFSRGIDMEFHCSCGGSMHCSTDDGDVSCVNKLNMIEGFPGEFKQVIINLIYNSVDAVEERMASAGPFRGRIIISAECGIEYLTVKICDNGTGISENTMPHIFEPYFTTKDEGKGTGIGLYMSKMIIENHMHGKIKAVSREDGACIEIVLPLLAKRRRMADS